MKSGGSSADGKLPPEKWAQQHGLMPAQRQLDGTRQPRPLWQHACAVVLHGWAEHAYHEAGPIMLSEADYLAAIKAAQKVVLCKDGKSQPIPYKGALSPHCPHFKDGLPEPVPVKE